MEARPTDERSLTWRDRLGVRATVGGLAAAAALTFGIKASDYPHDEKTSGTWHYGQGVEVVETDCNTMIDGTHCDIDSTWTVRYRQCEDDDFPADKNGNPPLKTPKNCVDRIVPDVRYPPSGIPVFYPENAPAEYPQIYE